MTLFRGHLDSRHRVWAFASCPYRVSDLVAPLLNECCPAHEVAQGNGIAVIRAVTFQEQAHRECSQFPERQLSGHDLADLLVFEKQRTAKRLNLAFEHRERNSDVTN